MSFVLANGADPETAFEWSAWAAAKGSPGPFCQPQSGTAQRRSMFVSLVDEHIVHDGVPGVVNPDEEQQQRRSSNAVGHV
jgi:hypothetical protein